jgi:hypothetical protein
MSFNVFEILKLGLSGVGFLFVYLVYDLLSDAMKLEGSLAPGISDRISNFMTLTVVLTVIVAGHSVFEIWMRTRKFSGTSEKDLVAGFGLKLENVNWEQEYKSNGDFESRIKYKVRNISDVPVVSLLPESASWFGWKISEDSSFKALGQDAGFYDLSHSFLAKNETKAHYADGIEQKITRFYWFPEVYPAIKPSQALEYSVNISTKATEKKLFLDFGTFAGMGTAYPAKKLSCKIKAPTGYDFVMLDFIQKDKLGIKGDEKISKPVLAEDFSCITWEIDNPRPNLAYLIRLKARKT